MFAAQVSTKLNMFQSFLHLLLPCEHLQTFNKLLHFLHSLIELDKTFPGDRFHYLFMII